MTKNTHFQKTDVTDTTISLCYKGFSFDENLANFLVLNCSKTLLWCWEMMCRKATQLKMPIALASFRQRLYNQSGNGQPDSYAATLRTQCPRSGGYQNLFFLDFVSPTKFDNNYFKNLLAYKGLLSSDKVLMTMNQQSRD